MRVVCNHARCVHACIDTYLGPSLHQAPADRVWWMVQERRSVYRSNGSIR